MIDPAIVDALARAPTTADEATTLIVSGAESLRGIERCRNLETLMVQASDLRDLDFVTQLPRLRELRVLACPLVDAEALTTMADRLEVVELDFTFLTDLTPFTMLRALRRGRMLGARWSQHSFRELRPRLLWGDLRLPMHPYVELGSEMTWNAGFCDPCPSEYDLIGAAFDEARPIVVRPGHTVDGTVDAFPGGPPTVSDAVEVSRPRDELLARLRDRRESNADVRAFDYRSHRRFGDATTALAWIAAAESELREEAEDLRAHVKRFPDAIFCREDDLVHAAWARAGAPLPESLRRIRRVLVGAWVDEVTAYKLDDSAARSEHVLGILDKRPSYWPSGSPWWGAWNPDRREPRHDVTVGVSPHARLYTTEHGARIYEVGTDDGEGDAPFDTTRRGYRDWAELLAHTAWLHLDDGSELDAATGAT